MEEEEGAVYLDDKRKKEEKEDLGVKKKKKDALKVFFEKATNSSPIRALNSALASRISGGQFALHFNSAAVVVTQSKALKREIKKKKRKKSGIENPNKREQV